MLTTLGPGIVTGAADDDPAGITTYSQAGAVFQYGLLWTVFLQLPLMIAVQYTCARIGLVTGRDLGRVLRDRYPVWVLWVVTLLLAVANTVTAGADLAAIGAAVQLITGLSAHVTVPVLSAALIIALVFLSYRLIRDGLKWLTLALLAYAVSGVLAHPDWSQVFQQTFIPGIQRSNHYLSLFVALFGTTISPYLFVWQSGEEVDDEKARDEQQHRQRRIARDIALRQARRDTVVGMTFSQIIGWFIIVCAGATLFPAGHRNITSASEAARALAPLGGGIGTILFSLGIVGTGLLAVPTLVGATAYAIAGLARKPAGMAEHPSHSKLFSGSVAAGTAIGAVFASSGMSAVSMLLLSALVNGILAPPMLVIILFVANNRTVMDDRRNGWGLNALVVLAAVIMGGAAIWLGVSTLASGH
jgi:NRAMP (natural resistance-associated macrophage protein)-like metal ion transporter